MTTFQPGSSFPLEENPKPETVPPDPQSPAPELAVPAKPEAENSKSESSLLASINSPKTLRVMRAVGYGLLLLSCIDLLYVLIPPELANPVWEYQTIGDLAKLGPVPLLAFMLVFYGETYARKRIEQPLLKFLSWSTLVIAIVFFLLLPLTLFDSVRISRFNNEQIDVQVGQQKLQIDETKKQVDKASLEELQNLVSSADGRKLSDAVKNSDQAKQQILSNLQKAKDQTDEKANQARSNLRFNLVKNTAKLVLQVLIAGFIFLYVWICTPWARDSRTWKYNVAVRNNLVTEETSNTAAGSPINNVNQVIKKMQRPVRRSHRRNM